MKHHFFLRIVGYIIRNFFLYTDCNPYNGNPNSLGFDSCGEFPDYSISGNCKVSGLYPRVDCVMTFDSWSKTKDTCEYVSERITFGIFGLFKFRKWMKSMLKKHGYSIELVKTS